MYTLHPIGRVRSSLTDPRRAPKQGEEGAPDAWLELAAEVAPGLQDLKVGDRVLILTWLDTTARRFASIPATTRPPRYAASSARARQTARDAYQPRG